MWHCSLCVHVCVCGNFAAFHCSRVRRGVKGGIERKTDTSHIWWEISPLYGSLVSLRPCLWENGWRNWFLKAGMHEKQHRVNVCNTTRSFFLSLCSSQDVRQKMKLLRRWKAVLIWGFFLFVTLSHRSLHRSLSVSLFTWRMEGRWKWVEEV